MNPEKAYIILRWCIGVVWLANGLLCKVLRLVPRHEQIVARILGTSYARPLTLLIGMLETCMAIWVFTGIKSKLNTWLQILTIAIMNVLEFILVPDLLLWGKLNALFAFLFILLLCYTEFYLHQQKPHSQHS